jgi:hypothetical protein
LLGSSSGQSISFLRSHRSRASIKVVFGLRSRVDFGIGEDVAAKAISHFLLFNQNLM